MNSLIRERLGKSQPTIGEMSHNMKIVILIGKLSETLLPALLCSFSALHSFWQHSDSLLGM